MKTYSEIYPIEGWAEKVSKSLTQIAEEKPNMYAKTKRRYEKLADSLLDSVAKIAIILEEDSLLSQNSDEFDELHNSSTTSNVILQKLEDLNAQFHRVEEFSGSSSPPRGVDASEKQPVGYKNHLAIEYFDGVLKESSIHNFGYSEVNECARLLYKWFHTRFRPDIPDPDFRYNIQYIPIWICNFIILYGKYHHATQNGYFKKIIDGWCMEVEMGSKGNYAIPFEMYQLDKDNNPVDYTIDAVVIGDILMNGQLFKLSHEEFEGVIHVEYDSIISVVRERNPSLHSKIMTRIAKRNQLIQETGLTPVGGIETDE